MTDIGNNIITSGVSEKNNIEIVRKFIYLNCAIITGVLFLVFNGIHLYNNGDFLSGFLNFTVAGIFVLIFFILRSTKNHIIITYIGILTITFLFSYLIVDSTPGKSGYLWSYIYPFYVIPLMGIIQGGILVSLYFSFLTILFYSEQTLIQVHFEPDFKFRFLNSFLVVTILAIITETIRHKLERKIQLRNKELEFASKEIKKRENAVHESEFTCKTLVERSNEGIVIVQDKIIQYINQSLSKMGGYTIGELINTPFTNYIADDKVKDVYANYMLRMANVQIPKVYHSILMAKNGIRVPVEIRGGRIPFQGDIADLVFIRRLGGNPESEVFAPEVITMPKKTKHP